MRVAYFVHELGDPAVQKRMRMLRTTGHRVSMLGFERSRPTPPSIGTPTFVLGQTQSGKFLHRALSVLLALPRAWSEQRHWADADVVLARNLETLAIVCALAPIVRFRGRLIYECLDIHRLLLRQDRVGEALRAIERRCLRSVSGLMVSSPAFVEHYFKPIQNYDGPVKLVENKIVDANAGEATRTAEPAAKPWTIAWCGVLRCAKSFALLRGLAAASDGRVQIALWGTPALDQIPDFNEAAATTPNMRFHGAYQREDLSRIYREAHFVWTGDYFEQGGNSDWLLPNRLYEGLAHGAVPLATDGVEAARWLKDHDVGVVLDEPVETSLPGFMNALNDETYTSLRVKAAGLDRTAVAFTREEALHLLDFA